jgi:hypothetical protein
MLVLWNVANYENILPVSFVYNLFRITLHAEHKLKTFMYYSQLGVFKGVNIIYIKWNANPVSLILRF